MARRDLSRTVIEGGRRYYNSYQRRASHGWARAAQREWLLELRRDPEDADEPAYPRVGRSFHDKLAVMYRWLVSQCGRPWSKVYSEIRARFDIRTTPGRHIVFDHLLDAVWRGEPVRDPVKLARGLYVDAHGILRRGRYYGMRYSHARARLLTGQR